MVLQRVHTYAEPFERDIATYAVIAREMRQGRPLYSDLWDNKPPLLYLIFAAAQVVAGEGPASIFLMGVARAVVTALALFAAGALGTSTDIGLWTAAFWAIVCADLPLQANQPNIEAFLNAALALGFVAFLRGGEGPRGRWPCSWPGCSRHRWSSPLPASSTPTTTSSGFRRSASPPAGASAPLPGGHRARPWPRRRRVRSWWRPWPGGSRPNMR